MEKKVMEFATFEGTRIRAIVELYNKEEFYELNSRENLKHIASFNEEENLINIYKHKMKMYPIGYITKRKN